MNITARHVADESAPHRDIATNPWAHRIVYILTHGPLPTPRTHRYVAAVEVAE